MNEQPRTTQRRDTTIAASPLLAIIGLNLVGALFPAFATWGFNFWSIVPSPLSWLLPSTALIAAILLIVFFPFRTDLPPARRDPNLSPIKVVAGSLALFALFYALRSHAHVYGDGFLLLDQLSNDIRIFAWEQDFQKPLTQLLFAFGGRIIAPELGLSVEQVIAGLNVIAGVVGAWALYRLAGELSEDHTGRLFLLIAAATSGAVILFFGYIEYYTWAMAVGLWALVFSIRALQGKSSIWLPILFGMVAVAFHLFALPFLIAAVLAAIVRLLAPELRPRAFRILNLAGVIGAAVVAAVFHIADFPQYFMPLAPLPEVPYWALMPEHLIDIANEVLLVSPLAFFVVLSIFWWRRQQTRPASDSERLLGTTALAGLIIAFWIEPKLSAVRDWDLLSFFAFPASLWAACLIRRARQWTPPAPRLLVLIGSLAAVVHLAPNFYEKTDLRRAAVHLDAMVADSPQHRPDYGKARRALVWGVVLRDAVGLPRLAIPHFHRRIAADSTSSAAWFSVAQWYYETGDVDSAAFYLRHAVAHEPENLFYLMKLTAVEMELRNFQNAVALVDHALQLKPNDPRIQMNAGILAVTIGQYAAALPHLQQAARLDPGITGAHRYLGLTYYHLGRLDSAVVHLRQAAQEPGADPTTLNILRNAEAQLRDPR